jgi:hypothetical protein
MSIRPHPVEQAANFLKSSSATPKVKLVIGGKFLWAAMMLSKDWTPELLDRARTMYNFLLKHGNVERTLEQMDEKAASRCLAQFTKDVTQLATDIKQARGQRPLPRKS